IALAVCPTSNLRLGVVPSLDAHPLRRLWDAGAIVSVNTDDPGFFASDLVSEYAIAGRLLGLDRRGYARLAANSVDGSFAPAAVTATYGVSVATQYPLIQPCTSHLMAMVSGFSTLIWIFGLNLGCAWFCEGLTVLVVWMLCRMPSLLMTSIVLPAGNTSTCGWNSHVLWSKTGCSAGTSSFFPFAALTV